MRIRDESGQELVATFFVEPGDPPYGLDLIFESAGGRTASGVPRNRDYSPALLLLLTRLALLGASLDDALLDSRNTERLPVAERRLLLAGRPFPVRLGVERDLTVLRDVLTAAQGTVASNANPSKGSNRRRRIRLRLGVPGYSTDEADRLQSRLAAPPPRVDIVLPPTSVELAPEVHHSPKSRSSGTGTPRQQDAAARLALEMYSMALATQYFEERGWQVADVSRTFSWDLALTAEGRPETHVEVKGTGTDGTRVELTHAEVEHAQSFEHMVLFIVREIRLDRSGEQPVAHGGTIRVFQDWSPAPARLTPSRYAYEVPE
ncbi:protein NO VEIN domain-containing protein [Actinoalloteichus hymeniacidonis]|uniref:DUF3883 family protein n=1 Tax=Actinoalloteichus hymeniacidonis TaxID=340345 RepID=A0AAC9N0I5_9PSEU|nr:DUF3883 domain-containing protein [Actinoalloteichus hymeniacidonis]AOS65117.1 putative DUF3883 family protein [Actinoalloteichus hymeniacidonis]MBB5906804.1 hypothetical protein [Actinoalloteichus hymeniacidonis]